MSYAIQTADLDWQLIDGSEVPVSKQFGDVYFSKDNGLLETRHVFLNGNDLNDRLAQLKPFEYFCVGETGFGTGLNILALWQLWRQLRVNNHSHLHVISVEKFPLSKADLTRALKAWPELEELSELLMTQYPLPLAGAHRLNFAEERFSIDLWLGDAHDILPNIEKTAPVNAWFLDGFAPSCNPDIWADNVLSEVVRLSDVGTTFSSFSVAGVLKRGLQQHGISISRPRGFGSKSQMLKAIWNPASDHENGSDLTTLKQEQTYNPKPSFKMQKIAVIGAGIAGLSSAWAFAQRGHQVTIYDQTAPLSGGSGNPLALLNPKLCPIEQTSEHLIALAWQYALIHYAEFKAFRPIQVNQLALKDAEQLLALADEYPNGIFSTLHADQQDLTTEYASLNLIQAGAVLPHVLSEEILAHDNIIYQQAKITKTLQRDKVQLFEDNLLLGEFDHVIACTARDTSQFFETYPILKPTRGQVSWLNNQHQPLNPKMAYSYAGYCMQLDEQHLIMGASFYPNSDNTETREEDHVHNYELIHNAFPEYAESLAPIATWQGRASVRALSQDYFPILGQMKPDEEIYSFAGLGSKGFLFAPLCAEVLAAQMLGEACPLPASLVKKLRATRFQKKVRVRKPYYKGPVPPPKNE